MTRMSTRIGCPPPTRSNSRSCSTLNNATWVSGRSSPTSSRKIVPPSASSKRPSRRCVAPVNAPFSWSNNSDEINVGANAAQFTLMKACSDLSERLWTARAMSSLPVPVSAPRNQNGGIRSSDFGSLGKNSLQRLRGADNFLEHRSPIHLVPQRQILSLQLVLELLDFLKRSFQLIFRTLAIGYVHRTTNELDEFSRWARDGMAHSVNPLESSVRKNNAELKVVIRFLTNCARDCCLPLVSILRMHALQPFFPPWHPSPRIKSVYAVPFL